MVSRIDREKKLFSANKSGKTGLKSKAVTSGDFQAILGETLNRDYSQKIEALTSSLDKASQRFSAFPVFENMKDYKDKVRELVNFILEKTYGVTEHQSLANGRNQKVFQLIETLNGKLEKLTQLVLNNELNNIQAVASTDEIRGIILDLYS